MEGEAPDSVESEVSEVSYLEGLSPATNYFSEYNNSFMDQVETTSDVESNACSDEGAIEILPDPDEETRTLPSEHQYLGELEQVRGRVIMDDDSVQKIPLLFPATQVTFVPGQPFPLIETEETAVNILKYAVEGDHIFGIIPASYWNPRSSLSDVVGTTAEIIACGESENGYKIKAIGRQRFKVLRVVSELINDNYITFAYIKILPEISLRPALEGAQLPSLNKFRSSHRFRCWRREASQTRWPAWIYRHYDEKYLVQDVKRELTRSVFTSKNIVYSDDPTTLSFQLLKNVPISENLMLEAMEMNSPVLRIHWIMTIWHSQFQKGQLKCVACHAMIGNCADIFPMSAEGPHGTYVNSLGYVHELITLRKVKHVFTSQGPETEYSWFPGYAWSVLNCKQCQIHLGWKFSATKKELVPTEFWGIKNGSIEIEYDRNLEKVTGRRIAPRFRLRLPRII